MKNKINQVYRKTYFMFTLPALVLYLVFFVLPVFTGIYYSLTDWNGLSKTFSFIGFENYTKLFSDKALFNSLKVNLHYVLVLIVVIPPVALVNALILDTCVKFKKFFRSVYFFPSVLSLMTIALIFEEIFYRAIPAIGESLNLSFLQSNILASKDTAIYGILIVNIWQGLAVPTVLYLAGLQTIPKDLYDAAAIDGANSWQRFVNITIRYIIPQASVVLVLTLKGGLTVFDYIMAMTRGGPAHATETIAYLIYQNGFTKMKFSYGITQSLLLFLIIGVISIIQIQYLNKKGVDQ